VTGGQGTSHPRGGDAVQRQPEPSPDVVDAASPGDDTAGAKGLPEALDWWRGVRDALACSKAMVVAVDRRGTIRGAGPMVAQRLGDTDVDGIVGQAVARFIVPAERPRGLDALRVVLDGREWQGPIRLVSARGVERLLKLRVSPLRAASGELRGALAELDPAASGDGISRERLDAQSKMAAGLAHNFNNLLTVIRSGTYMLARELPDESPLQGYVREIEEAAERATGWARQLGAIGRTIIYRPVAMDPGDLLRAAMELLVTIAPEGVRIHLELPAEVPEVLVDPARLGQALRALVRNAVDAVGEEGEITLGLQEEVVRWERAGAGNTLTPGRYLAFFVRDDGHGIPPDVLAHIWEPYFTTRGPARGVGLGLPTAAVIARESGGALELQSEVHRGTTARLLVPLPAGGAEAVEPPEAPSAPPGPDLRSGGSRAVILVVEDDKAVLHTVKMILQRRNIRPVTAENARQARRLLTTPGLHFDMAILDVLLPDGRGDDVGAEGRELHPGLPLIFVSGYVAEKPLAFKNDSNTRFVRKPFTPTQLIDAIQDLIAGRAES